MSSRPSAYQPRISRVWAMPHHETFSIKPIGDLVRRYLASSHTSVDPFARNTELATYTNDLNPQTSAQYHVDALEFLQYLAGSNVRADLVLMDPPYSPRQVKESYDSIGLKTPRSAVLTSTKAGYKAAIVDILAPGGVVITCGWNTVGMGKTLGFRLEEILIVCHGSDHNDTLVTVERLCE